MSNEHTWDSHDRHGPDFFDKDLPEWILDEAVERLVNEVADPRRDRLIEQLDAELSPAGQKVLSALVNLDLMCQGEIVSVVRDLWPRILAIYRPPGAILDHVLAETGAEPWQIPSHWLDDLADSSSPGAEATS